MTSHLTTLLGRHADRLAVTLESAASAVLYGPPEFHVRDVAEATVARLGLTPVRRSLREATDSGSWREALTPLSVLLLDWDGPSEELVPAWTAFVDAAAHDRLPLVIVVSESDVVPPVEVFQHFQVVLGPMSMAVRSADLARLGEAWEDVSLRHEVLRLTAGSTGLVLAAVEEVESRGDAALPLSVEVARQAGRARGSLDTPLSVGARAWATRLVDLLPADDHLVLLHAMLPGMSAQQMAAVATSVLHREVTVDDVMDARLFPAIHRQQSRRDTFAPAVAAQIVRLVSERDPGTVLLLRHAVAEAALDRALPLDALERVSALVGTASWASLDKFLARTLPSIALLTTGQRGALAEILPSEVLSAWPYLHWCREFLTQDEVTPHALPSPWLGLLWLLSVADGRELNDLTTEMRDRLVMAVSTAHSPSIDALQEGVDDGIEFLSRRAALIHERAAASYSLPPCIIDDAPLVVLALLGESDGALAMGRIILAQRCLNEASQLLEVIGADVERAAALRLGLASRQALLSSFTGVRGRTETLLADYEDLVEEAGVREPEPEHIVLVARRFLAQTTASDVRVSGDIAPNTTFTPLEVQAEAFLILLQRGPEVASDWVQTFLSRAPFTDLGAAEWWPLHTVAAFLALRENRPEDALRVLETVYVPETAAQLIRAGAALAEEDLDGAEALIRQVVRDPEAPDRWRRLAFGFRVTILARRRSPELAAEADAHLVDWAEAPAIVALFPEEGRRVALAGLDPQMARLRGLRVDEETPAASSVVLTPRQLDVLAGLATDLTLQEIADRLFLGVETVRSTSKALYRRLGVHSREAAVRVARLTELLPPDPALPDGAKEVRRTISDRL